MATSLTEIDLIKLARLLDSGLSRPQIGKKLYLSLSGVNTRLYILYQELGVDSKEEALRRARHLGWLNDLDSELVKLVLLCKNNGSNQTTAECILSAFDDLVTKKYIHLSTEDRLKQFKILIMEIYSEDKKVT